jgi:hypothetical protein
MGRNIRNILVLGAVIWISSSTPGAEEPAKGMEFFQQQYHSAKGAYEAQSSNSTNAWQFARACFQLADLSTSDGQRAPYATEGIDAAESAIALQPDSAPAHYYLALNVGQLAQTKMLGALKLVKQMERELLRAISLHAGYDHAGAERSLGMLYRDTPGWPASIGSKSKARKELELSVKLAPDYPDNHLTLMESYLKWDDRDGLKTEMSAYRQILPKAKKTFAGREWELAWKDWERRWNEILLHSP